MTLRTDILRILAQAPNGMTPTHLGQALGRGYFTASSAVTGPLKRLVAAGLVERIALSRSQVTYRITAEGHAALAKGDNP